ncbi:hypothetical protein ALC60_02118 [Trachymyrmex zeteki]|uniref:Uncharacterized protein n=1 Tax=Mycetomoellerius zeteki TaxID=64791 RepID=A0A151XEQ4_9HYME|nr:hypothetical protein ALC60_02118 [Trachymyrmex zeteki]
MGKRKHGEILPSTIPAIICGPSNCGKTNVLINKVPFVIRIKTNQLLRPVQLSTKDIGAAPHTGEVSSTAQQQSSRRRQQGTLRSWRKKNVATVRQRSR